MADQAIPEKKPRFKVTYEASVFALVTFAISMVSLGWQVVNYLQGAKIRIIPPDQIVIGSSKSVDFASRDQGQYVHFIVRMSYVNEGATGFNATMRRERIIVKLDGYPPFEQRWYRFVVHDVTGPTGSDLKVDKVSDARAFPVVAGNAETHATVFQPWPRLCEPGVLNCDPRESYLPWDKFLDLFAAKRTMEIEVLSEAFGQSKSSSSKCRIEMDENSFAAMKRNGWGSPICR